MSIAYNTSIVRSGLILNLDAANIKSYLGSGTVWTDISGQSVSASLQNAVSGTVTGTGGSAGYLNFAAPDATSTVGYYQITSSAISSAVNQSLETCVYVNTFHSSQARPVSPRITEGGSPLGFGLYNGSIAMELNAGGSWFTATASNANITSGKWLHISQSLDDGAKNLKTYFNGVLINTLPYTGVPISCSGFLLGRGFYGGILNYAGRIGFVRSYNKALTATEIQQNFEATRGRYSI